MMMCDDCYLYAGGCRWAFAFAWFVVDSLQPPDADEKQQTEQRHWVSLLSQQGKAL